jgi:hypothetical protein
LVESLPEVLFQVSAQIGVYDEATGSHPGLRSTFEIRDAQGLPIPHDENFDTSAATFGPSSISRGDRAAATDFARRVRTRFERDAPLFLLLAAACFEEIIREIETAGKPKPEEAKEALEYPLSILRMQLEGILGIKEPPRRIGRNKWARVELTQALREAARSLPKEERTYANVATRLLEKEPERAPASGEALRKLCERLGVKTSLIKRGGKRTPKV